MYLVVGLEEGELFGLQERGLGDVQAVLSVQELDHAAVTGPHRQVILDHQTLQVLNHTSVTRHSKGGGGR